MSIGINNATQYDEEPLSSYVDEDEWNSMSEDDKSEKLRQWALGWSDNYLDLGASVDS